MKYLFAALLLIVAASLATHAQKSTGGSASASSSGTSQQTGFVYFLQKKGHLQYSANFVDTYYFTFTQLRGIQKPALFEQINTNRKVYTATFYFDRKVMHQPSATPINLVEYDLRPFNADADLTNKDIDAARVAKLGDDDTVLIVKVQYRDTIPRYWNPAGNLSPFRRLRLNMSITQDSANLYARLLRNNFREPGDGPGSTHKAAVTNPAYRGHLSVFQHQFGASTPGSDLPFSTADSLVTAKIGQYVAAKRTNDTDDQWEAYQDATAVFKGLEMSFERELKSLYKIEQDSGTKRNFYRDRAAITGTHYQILTARLHTLDRFYVDLTSEYKQKTLNVQYNELRDPADINAIISMDYIEAILKLNDDYPRDLVSVPLNTFDTTIPERAIEIGNKDSAANYYFKIIHKSLSGQPVYYMRYHYASWDYGTLTIPYRYRPAPKHKYVFGQAAKDSPVVAQSFSEASISLAAYFGRKWGRTRFYENPSQTHNTVSYETAIVTGPSLVSLSINNVDTTSKYINATTKYNYAGPSNMIAWTLGAGAVLQWKTINFGVFAGWDFPLVGKTGWVYANKTWYGFGIGVNLGMFATGNPGN